MQRKGTAPGWDAWTCFCCWCRWGRRDPNTEADYQRTQDQLQLARRQIKRWQRDQQQQSSPSTEGSPARDNTRSGCTIGSADRNDSADQDGDDDDGAPYMTPYWGPSTSFSAPAIQAMGGHSTSPRSPPTSSRSPLPPSTPVV